MQAIEDSRTYLSHKRAILYIQTDVLDLLPGVNSRPAALRWEDKVLACNQAAQSHGISKELPFKKAVQLCPGLIVLGAEHISPLVEIVNQVNKVLRSYSLTLERVNVDECFLDITSHPQLLNVRNGTGRFGKESCPCGCQGLLFAARILGEQLQNTLCTSLRIRSRVGVSYSKLLARFAAIRGSLDQCSVIVPDEIRELLFCEDNSHILPEKITSALQMHGIHTTADIRKLSLDELQSLIGLDDSVTAINAACGVDPSSVLTCDLWRLFCVEYEVREKFCVLLLRLLSSAEDDRRIPTALKVSVRKWDPVRKVCSKEAKTAPISSIVMPSIGRTSSDVMVKLMSVIMSLFRRLVDMSRPFQLSLLGLAFVRFHENAHRPSPSSSHSVAACLLRKRELSVEVQINVSSDGDGSHRALPIAHIDVPVESLEIEEPLDKKAKLDILIKSKRFTDERMDVCSPNKLRVADLSLGESKSSARGLLHW